MKKPTTTISREDIKKMQTWLQEQIMPEGIAPQDYTGLILYKLLELEQRLKNIEFNQQTHWVN